MPGFRPYDPSPSRANEYSHAHLGLHLAPSIAVFVPVPGRLACLLVRVWALVCCLLGVARTDALITAYTFVYGLHWALTWVVC